VSYPSRRTRTVMNPTENTTPSTEATAARIQLSDDFSAPAEWVECIRLHIVGRLAALQQDRIYTAKKLAGRDFWDSMSSGEQRLAGRCIAHLVSHGELPLEFVRGKHEYPKHYRLK
jgi:hypothetical protein